MAPPELIAILLQISLHSVTSYQSHKNSSYTHQYEGQACIDDSDCTLLGHKYLCYLYKCINWMEQPRCHQPSPQCPPHHQCQRISTVYDELTSFCAPVLPRCAGHQDCEDTGHMCCRDTCCHKSYFDQWKQFSCVIDEQCEEWRTGRRCCVGGRCCDEEVEDHSHENVSRDASYGNKDEISGASQTSHNVFEHTITNESSTEFRDQESNYEMSSSHHDMDTETRTSRHSPDLSRSKDSSSKTALPLKNIAKSGAGANICQVFVIVIISSLSLLTSALQVRVNLN